MSLTAMFRLALAETRRSGGKLMFCIFSIAVGVASLTAVRTAVLGLEDGIQKQARNLMGADLMMRSSRSLDEGIAAELSERWKNEAGAESAELVEFYSMLYSDGTTADTAGETAGGAVGAGESANDEDERTRLVRVRAVGGGFPFYGEIETEPADHWQELAKGTRPLMIADTVLLSMMDLKAGDAVTLGGQKFTIAAAFLKKPGSPASGFGFAPAVYIHANHLDATGLVGFGSRVRYQRLFALPPEIDPEELKTQSFEDAIDAGVTIQTFRESADRVQRFLYRLSHFLTMAGLITLLLGGLGIGSAMTVFIREKLDHAAVLRSLGMRPGQVFQLYLMLALVLGAAGSLIGVIPGSALPVLGAKFAASELGGEFLPIELDIGFSWLACVQGFTAGIVATLLFTLFPVYRIRGVSPLRVLRRVDETESAFARFDWRDALVFGGAAALIFGFVLLLTVTQTNSVFMAFAFTGSIAGAILVLALAARLVIYGTRRLLPHIRNYHLRQGIANLYRPGNQTAAVITAVGIGVLLVASVLILEASIQSEIAVEDRADLPNMFVVDLQPSQLADFQKQIENQAVENVTLVPLVSARIASINGQAIERRNIEQSAVQRTWDDRLRTREYFVSYRDELLDSEDLVAGEWWEGGAREQEVSVSDEWADRMNVDLGDRVTLDIQGIPLTARVTSFRKIHWQAMRPNSILILSPGLIENAPRIFVSSFRIAGEEERTRFQTRLVKQFPNLSVIDVTEAAANFRLILDRISLIVRILAVITLLNGVVILGGAVAAGRFARLREMMLLKVLGAARGDLRKILIAEYAILAVLGCLCGWLLAEAVNRPMLAQFFEASPVVPYLPVLLTIAGVVVLNTAIGLFISRDVARTAPLHVLRDPG